MEKLGALVPRLLSGLAGIERPIDADDTGGHRVGQPEGVANGDDHFANFHLGGIAHRDRFEERGRGVGDLDDGQIGVGVSADQLRIIGRAVREGNGDLGRAGNHMVVGHDVTRGIPNEAGTFGDRHHLALASLAANVPPCRKQRC